MLLRLFSIVVVSVLVGLVGCLVWLLSLPLQPDFTYDSTDPQFALVKYIDFVFLITVVVTIVVTITRSYYQVALRKDSLSVLDKRLFTLMSHLPFVLICTQCAAIMLAILFATLQIGFYF